MPVFKTGAINRSANSPIFASAVEMRIATAWLDIKQVTFRNCRSADSGHHLCGTKTFAVRRWEESTCYDQRHSRRDPMGRRDHERNRPSLADKSRTAAELRKRGRCCGRRAAKECTVKFCCPKCRKEDEIIGDKN